ncbi:hypothetical protein QQX98_002898 [Neonectria punicea]|uniref:Uncharacterized protein n=1 Tax=Neonectria punicea TaxID=979145 RepID=A0ABR1HHM5_9HYPO
MASNNTEGKLVSTTTFTPLQQGEVQLYAYELPPVAPGSYTVSINQSVTADGVKEDLPTTVKDFEVKAIDLYSLSPLLVHSFYPPRLHEVPGTELPQIVLKGAVPWVHHLENSEELAAPVPWLALLVFRPSELDVPSEVKDVGSKPSSTMAITLPRDTVAKTTKFEKCHPLPPNVTSESADFVFLRGSTFKSYFEDQTPGASQQKPSLRRYPYLVHIKKFHEDGSDSPWTKLSTVLGHRINTSSLAGPQLRHAHLVSLEGVHTRIDWATAIKDDGVVPLVSLYSWSFKWTEDSSLSSGAIFNHIKGNVRPLALDLHEPGEDKDEKEKRGRDWVKKRLNEGYTIVRHRDIAGQTSMALYRGPLTPRQPLRVQIKPSMHGTDLQIVNTTTQLLDVSYSMAWDLGRSFATRNAKFASAITALRRKLCVRAALGPAGGIGSTGDVTKGPSSNTELIADVVGKLQHLFSKVDGQDGKIKLHTKLETFPAGGPNRWLVSQSAASTAPPGVMTHAKLKRNLEKYVRGWLTQAAERLANEKDQNTTSENGEFDQVIRYVVADLLSLKFIPPLYLFPDPRVLLPEHISTFLIDDAWVDAMIDGALGIGNSVGGHDDPAKEEIRHAINKYLEKRTSPRANAPASGLVLKSGIVDSFPDMKIKATSEDGVAVPVLQTQQRDMTMALFDRDATGKVADLKIEFQLPTHQNQYSLHRENTDDLRIVFDLWPYLKDAGDPASGTQPESRRWQKGDEVGVPGIERIVDWDTGVLVPQAIFDAGNKTALEKLGADKYKEPSPDSGSVYLSIFLQGRDSVLIVPFKASNNVTHNVARQLFPERQEVSQITGPETSAVVYSLKQAVEPKTRPPVTSVFAKTVYTLQFPGKSIPLQAYPVVDIVFAFWPAEASRDYFQKPAKGEVVKELRIERLDVIIPIGDGADHLLAPDAPLPSVRVIGSGMRWTATSYRLSPAQLEAEKVYVADDSADHLMVRLRPRGTASIAARTVGATDPSFVLTGATINGVLGDKVPILTRDTYLWDGTNGADGERIAAMDHDVYVAKE